MEADVGDLRIQRPLAP